jgi:hypothetical protein
MKMVVTGLAIMIGIGISIAIYDKVVFPALYPNSTTGKIRHSK